jgi:hypothetical protein
VSFTKPARILTRSPVRSSVANTDCTGSATCSSNRRSSHSYCRTWVGAGIRHWFGDRVDTCPCCESGVMSDDDPNVPLRNRFSPLGTSTAVTSRSSLGSGAHIVQLLERNVWGVARWRLTPRILLERLDEYPLKPVTRWRLSAGSKRTCLRGSNWWGPPVAGTPPWSR